MQEGWCLDRPQAKEIQLAVGLEIQLAVEVELEVEVVSILGSQKK